ncbi:spore germination protein [Rossellomorea vietnamensis]|uniref:Spore germination protein n=1 Tax=Rossellomorea vietnamensis TaxID=218284 RepID=A0A5D4NTW3_9BACI|nr:spore germination protein [Rossellomorea vietnamensis]TYS16756.1 spore germination protein [Rossellomorea vietnamensis]
METFLNDLDKVFEGNEDYMVLEQMIGDVKVVLVGLNSLIDFPKSIQALENHYIKAESNTDFKRQMVIHPCKKGKVSKDLIQSLLEGKMIVWIRGEREPFIFFDTIETGLSRSIEAPTNDNILQGPLNSFSEDISMNIGMIRKEIQSSALRSNSFIFGTVQRKKVSLLYRTDKVDNGLLSKVTHQMESNRMMDLSNLQDITKMLGIPNKSLISYFYKTELPQEVQKSLAKGKVVVFLDRFPFALVLPNEISDMFFLENDRNFTFPLMIAMRLLRIAGALIALILPGLYVALVAVNPEMLRIELALTVAETREGVPYPAFVEALLMLLVLELILEASIRLPKSIGPTITMVGGIILGQAAVEARLVSNLLIIILAATTIASSTIIGFQNSLMIRIFKYIILLFSAIFGVVGLFAGLFLISAYMSSFKVIGFPYFALRGVHKSG